MTFQERNINQFKTRNSSTSVLLTKSNWNESEFVGHFISSSVCCCCKWQRSIWCVNILQLKFLVFFLDCNSSNHYCLLLNVFQIVHPVGVTRLAAKDVRMADIAWITSVNVIKKTNKLRISLHLLYGIIICILHNE